MSSGKLLVGSGAPFITTAELIASATTQSHTAIAFLWQGSLPRVVSEDFLVTNHP
jgi:hypothetical protein